MQQGPNPAQQALVQFLQGTNQGTAPIIQAAKPQTTVNKPGRAATFGNLVRALGKGTEAGADLVKGDFSGAEDAAKEHAGVLRLERAFGKPTVTTTNSPTSLPNQAPTLYWGNMLK